MHSTFRGWLDQRMQRLNMDDEAVLHAMGRELGRPPHSNTLRNYRAQRSAPRGRYWRALMVALLVVDREEQQRVALLLLGPVDVAQGAR